MTFMVERKEMEFKIDNRVLVTIISDTDEASLDMIIHHTNLQLVSYCNHTS